MEVLCKLLVLCALVFSANIFTTAESTNSNGVRNELILKNLLFDGITGGLKIPELNELKNLNECAAIYNIKIIERVIIASSKLRQCANVKEFELLTFLQQQSSSAVKTAFQQKMTACSKHECFADLIMDLFNAVHPMLRRVWQIKRCVIHEIKNAALEVEKSNDACRIAFLRVLEALIMANGICQLQAGTGQLQSHQSGTGQLQAGTGRPLAGICQLQAGTGQLQSHQSGTGQLQAGIGRPLAGICQLQAGTGRLLAGICQLQAGTGRRPHHGTGQLQPHQSGTGQLQAGTGRLLAGICQLQAGTGRLLAGICQLQAGTGRRPHHGTGQLQPHQSGTGQLQAGTGRLLAGICQLQTGTGRLLAGICQLQAGTGRRPHHGTGQLQPHQSGTGQLQARTGRLLAGICQLQAGTGRPLTGICQLQAGTGRPPTGIRQLQAGTGRPPTGICQLQTGIRAPRTGI
ncbi:uncharacterized protein LOC6560328 isoform X4 [Drosophila grimshawi]|uniref:uncharacterized protein LOC6560328 isoform X4 n=1 Tax=Drosophila grimshawi TaxID=7222 RepID=UPI001C934E67|nr:uncharacterized protein LOC6560328 isoform X4 [Drosophila grimshawi]